MLSESYLGIFMATRVMPYVILAFNHHVPKEILFSILILCFHCLILWVSGNGPLCGTMCTAKAQAITFPKLVNCRWELSHFDALDIEFSRDAPLPVNCPPIISLSRST